MTNTPTKIFNAQATSISSARFPSVGDFMTLVASGVFGGATITVEVSPDGGTTWVATSATLTAAGITNFIGGEGLFFRFTLSGHTGTTSVSAWVAYQD